MIVESIPPDRAFQLLLCSRSARFAWIVVGSMLLLWTTLAHRVYGDAPVRAQKTSLVANADQAATNQATQDPIELTAQSEPVEVIDDRSLRNRLIGYAFFGGLTLVFLGVLFGYLRLDHATRGFHTGRLQLVALILLGIVLVVGYLLWTQVLFK